MGLDITGIGSVADILGKVFDKVSAYIPDPVQKAAAQQKLAEMAQAQEFKNIDAVLSAAQQQTDINKQEAASTSLFVAGWRPGIGWSCATAFFWSYVLAPLLTFILAAAGHPVSLPVLDVSGMMPVLLGMLGLGSMRSIEKIKGATAASNH